MSAEQKEEVIMSPSAFGLLLGRMENSEDERNQMRDALREILGDLATARDENKRLIAEKHWIPIDERLPEMRPYYENSPLRSERVLVTDGQQVDISRYSETYKKRIPRWENTWLKWTHWMPLPHPPDAAGRTLA